MCGIFGIIQAKKKRFDKRAFITLGVANDRRGGDSCGIFIDGDVEYGVKENKFFVDFMQESKLLKNVTDARIILGHCRKASVGVINQQNAQPVVIYNGKKPEFVLLHNGTIYNYKELAQKYIPDIDIKDMTDSKVMAYIFYHRGYDVLTEYNGGGMFVIYDLRANKVLLFKGSSLLNGTATKATEERPCYFVTSNDFFVFSSIYEELQGLYYGNTVYILPSNILLEVNGNKIYNVETYDRSNCKQYKSYTPSVIINDCYSYFNNDYCSSAYITFNQKKHLYIDDTFQPANGLYYVSNYGAMNKHETNWYKPRYFYNGYLLYNKKCFDFLKSFAQILGESSPQVTSAKQLLSVNPIIFNDKLYKPDIHTFKLKTIETMRLPLTCNLAIMKDDKVIFEPCSTKFTLDELTDSDFLRIIDYVKSI